MTMIESEVRSYCRNYPVVFNRATGARIWDTSGKSYLDFLCGCGSLNYGHNNPAIKDALLRHIEADGMTMSLDLETDAKAAFLAAFGDHILAPRSLSYRAQFTGPTGANAVEAAIKLARKVTGRSNVVAFTNAFHGCSLGALSLTANAYQRNSSEPFLTNVTRMPYDGYLGPGTDTTQMLEKMLGDPSSGVAEPAAIIVETLQGEGGLNNAGDEWLRNLSALAKRHGSLLIVDDIQAGCGRTGDFFSFEKAGIRPDIVTLAKSISGFGLPMAMVLLSPELDKWLPAEHNGTFRGNNYAFVTARTAIETYWKDIAFARALGQKAAVLGAALSRIGDVYGYRRKGRGLLQGLDLGDSATATEVQRTCFQNGLIIETCGPSGEVLKFMPPLTVSDVEMTEAVNIVMHAISKNVGAADLEPVLA